MLSHKSNVADGSSGLQRLLCSLKIPLRLPLLYTYIILITSYLQILVLVLTIALKEFKNRPQNTMILDIVFYFMGIEIKYAYKYPLDREIVLMFVLIYQFLQTILFVTTLFRLFFRKEKPDHILCTISRIAISLHFYIFFLPIQCFLIENLKQNADGYITLSAMADSVFTGLSILATVLNFLYSFIGNFTYTQIQDKDYFAKRNSSICSLAYIYKVLACILLQLTLRDAPSKWILLCASIAYILLSYYIFHTEFVFYHTKTVKLVALAHGNVLVCVFVVLGAGIWDEIDTISVPNVIFVFWSLLLPFATMRERAQIRKTFQDALKMDPKKISTEGQHFKRILALKWVFTEGCKENWKSKKRGNNPLQILLLGLVRQHMLRCSDPQCPCKKVVNQEQGDVADKEFSVNKAYLNEVLKAIVEDALVDGAIYTKGRENVLLDKACFHLRKENKFLKSYLTFKQLKLKKGKNTNVFANTSMQILQAMIEEAVKVKCGLPNTQQQEKLHIKELIKHNELVEEMKGLMAIQTEKQLQLWNNFNETLWNAYHLFRLSREIEGYRVRIEAVWSKINAISHNDLVVFLLFGLYSSVVNNNILRSEKLLKKIDVMNLLSLQSAEGVVTNANLYDASNMYISIGMDRERLGKIEGFSRNTTDTFGYTNQELMGSNVAILMPNFLRKRHQKFLTKHLDTQTGKLFNNQKFTFSMNKKGYALPINLYISVYPTLRNGLSYFSVVRPIKEYREYILLNNSGYIDTCTENMSLQLGIDPIAKRIHISEVCPDFGKVNQIFASYVAKQKQQKIKDDKVTQKEIDTEKGAVDEEEIDLGITTTFTHTQTRAEFPLLKGSKFDKSLNLITDAPIESVTPRKNTFMETVMETTFRAIQKDTSTIPPKMEEILDEEQSKAIHHKFSTEGEIINFFNFTDKTLDSYYHCQVTEEIYDGSVLRILALSQETKKTRFEEMEEMEEAAADERSRSSPLQSLGAAGSRRRSGSSHDSRPGLRMPNENEEDSFLQDAAIPDEKTDDPEKSRRSNAATKSFMGHLEGISATSRFRDVDVSKEKEKPSFLDTLQFDKSTQQLFPMPMISSMRKNNNASRNSLVAQSMQSYYNALEKKMDLISSEELKDRSRNTLPKGSYVVGGVTSGSDPKKTKSHAVMNTDPIKKFFQQHSLHIKKDGENASSTGTASSASTTRILRAVEKAFGEWKKVNRYVNWIIIAIINCVVAFAMLIAYFNVMRDELAEIKYDSESLFHVGRRLNAFVELNRDVQILDLYLKGYVTRDRHAHEGIPDYIERTYFDLNDDMTQMDFENTLLRSYIFDLSEKLQKELYADRTTFNIYNETTEGLKILTLNTFDAVNQLIMHSAEVLSTPSEELETREFQISSILDNALNDLFINVQKPYEIYAAKIGEDFDIVDKFFVVAIIIIFVTFLFVIVVSDAELRVISRDTNKFWESLLRFEIKNAETHKRELRILLNGFRQNHSFDELFTEVNNLKPIENNNNFPSKSITKGNSSKDSGAFIKRNHNWTRLRTYMPVMLPASLAFIMFLTTLSASKILLAIEVDKRDIFVRELKTVDQTYQKQSLATTLMYQYVANTVNTLIEHQPIDVVLENLLLEISNVGSFVNSFELNEDGDTEPILEEDLCTTVFTEYNITQCSLIGKGANTKGLAGMVSFLGQSLQYIKDYYDQNRNSSTAIADTLNLEIMKEVELEFDFLDAAFVSVALDLEGTDQREQEKFEEWFFIALFIIMSVELLLWMYLMWTAYRNMTAHKENHALVMKNIPIILIWESKLMKNYIFTLFKASFQSIKSN